MSSKASAPAVILVRPQLGQNIGACARAMLNCGLTDMRLVGPRDGWPNSAAFSAASNADSVLAQARVFDTAAEAVADLHQIYASTARTREMLKPVVTAEAAAGMMRADVAAGRQVGVLFGPERTGLENPEVVLAQSIITVPLNPEFDSLNLAQAVLVIGYEWHKSADATPGRRMPLGHTKPATAAQVEGLFSHLEAELELSGFFAAIPDKRESVLINIRNIFQRVRLMEQDTRTLRGVIKALAWGRPRRPPRRASKPQTPKTKTRKRGAQ
jgi:tRNA/rRNA methyltransferase